MQPRGYGYLLKQPSVFLRFLIQNLVKLTVSETWLWWKIIFVAFLVHLNNRFSLDFSVLFSVLDRRPAGGEHQQRE